MKTRGEKEMWGWEKKFLFIKHKIQPTYLLPFGPLIISAHLIKSLVDLISFILIFPLKYLLEWGGQGNASTHISVFQNITHIR
jgi:hypothetical protein